jgi:hypothetical protein
MGRRWRTAAVVPVLALSFEGCSDASGPGTQQLVDLLLDFCASEAPAFFAFQNEGGGWTRVTPSAGSAFAFQATEKVGIAMTFVFGSATFTDVFFATAADLEPLSGVACTEAVGNKTLNGSVANVATGERAVVSMSGAEETVAPPQNSFTFAGIADGPQDIIAHRDVVGVSSDVPNRVIVRRGVNLTNGATIPVLNFGTEGAAPATHSATITGLTSGENNYFDIFFSTATGTSHTLFQSPFFGAGAQTIYGIPSSLTQSGDLHRIDLNADASNVTSYRSLRHFYRNPDNKTLALGPSLNSPSVSSFGNTPYVRLRATLASQSEYGSFATAFFIQGQASERSFFVTETSGYRGGTPTSWTLEIPDVTGAGGFPTSAGLQSGQNTLWFVEAYGGSLSELIGGTPTDGSTVRFAGRTSSIQTLQLHRMRGLMGGARRSTSTQRPLAR